MTTLKERVKSHFAEVSADIVWNEREHKKCGQRYNLGQSIAAALERAYKLGKEQSDTLDDQLLEPSYIDVPRRFRGLIDTMVMYSEYPNSGILVFSDGTANIVFDIYDENIDVSSRYKKSTVAALVKLGMLVQFEEVEFEAYQLSGTAKELHAEHNA